MGKKVVGAKTRRRQAIRVQKLMALHPPLPIVSNGKQLVPGTREYAREIQRTGEMLSEEEFAQLFPANRLKNK